MAKIITISSLGDIQNAVAVLERIKKNVPASTIEAIRTWGKILEKDMKVSLRRAGVRTFTGELQGNGIRWEQGKRSQIGYLFMRIYGIYLDSMRPHYVNITRRRTRLLLWAKGGAMSSAIIEKAWMVDKKVISKFSIYVRPHPFIKSGWNISRPKLNPIIRRAVSRSVTNA